MQHNAGATTAEQPLAERILSQTTKGTPRPCMLVLADGAVFYGRACGAQGEATGEICFNTSLEGYLEVLTDPSYAGQIITMTYPQIGNYGVNLEDVQSAKPALRGMVVHDMCRTPHNWRSDMSVPEFLEKHGIVAIEGVDTRALTRHIRDFGAQTAIISTEDLDPASLKAKVDAAPSIVGINLARTVSCDEPHSFAADALPASQAFAVAAPAEPRYKVVAYDCGAKLSILQNLVRAGAELTVVPWNTPAADVLAMSPDGVFLSNGPGDPDAVEETYTQVKQLIGKVPVFGICLGHQMVSLACGGKMEKLKFGHRGGNHPVRELATGHIEMTSQNHSYAVDAASLEGTGLEVTHINLLDNTVEGMKSTDGTIFSVQYHPESKPGPQDSAYLFDRFVAMLGKGE